jgi:hypothetical protein
VAVHGRRSRDARRDPAEQRPEDIVDLLNRKKPGLAAAVLLALPDAKAVAVLDQPRLVRGAAHDDSGIIYRDLSSTTTVQNTIDIGNAED